MHTVLIAIHATAGGAGLLLAVPVVLAPKRRGRHPVLGRAYAICAALLCASAFGLILSDPGRLIGLAVIGALTAVWVAGGVWIARRRPVIGGRPDAWRLVHLTLMGSSVVSFVTAFAVQITDGNVAAWLVPSVIGSLLIARANARETARQNAPRTAAEPAAAATR
ncbi:DUF2306 domain-containing protein [Rhizomonospora bruguierae]|uniref:hypothetical protein n=1 Tax=Rhizomonospora bruguierae TaxID=1581705 RepID=UPI001BCE29D7|nr:hypothetical protein [Micromonospora sp. NBRC 107566]